MCHIEPIELVTLPHSVKFTLMNAFYIDIPSAFFPIRFHDNTPIINIYLRFFEMKSKSIKDIIYFVQNNVNN